jgi:hypothetical protein
MLSTLVQQQKYWTIPLMVSLALSWCLLLCGGLVNQAHAQAVAYSPNSETVQLTETPPCHGKQALAATDISGSNTLHDNCSGCESQATQLDPLSLPAMIILVSWLHTADIWLVSQTVDTWLVQAPPPRPAVPLYLRKNLLLI